MFWRLMPIALVAWLFGTSASAQVQETGPGDYHCAAPPGQYFNREIPPLEVGKPITVRFRLIAEHADPKWFEQAAVYFRTPTGRMDVQVGKADNEPDHIYVALLDPASGYSEIVNRYPLTNLWIEIKLTLTPRGIVQVKSGNVNELNLKTKLPVRTELHCHSGEFEIQVVRPRG